MFTVSKLVASVAYNVIWDLNFMFQNVLYSNFFVVIIIIYLAGQ